MTEKPLDKHTEHGDKDFGKDKGFMYLYVKILIKYIR